MPNLIGMIALGVLLAACGGLGDIAGSDATVQWPETSEDTSAGSCVYKYPEDLEERPYAFDGTVVSVSRGEYVEDAGSTPLELRVQINEAFNGDLSDTVTVHTWDFSSPESGDTVDLVGARILAATGDTMDLMGCGFTRPYSVEDAELWRTTFRD